MKQTGPNMIIKKYRSILIAAVIVESVSFIVSLTDSIVAGSIVGADAFAAIGLLFPFVSLSTFFASMINSGTVLLYSNETGAFHKEKAHEYFSQGVILAISTGVIFTAVMLLCKNSIVTLLNPTPELMQYLSDYYDIYIFYFIMAPISCLLDNHVVADGGEKLSAASNTIQIVGNIVLSIILSQSMGVKGIALATVLCKALFIILICIWFFTKHCTLKMVFCFHLSDCLLITKRGVVRASTFAMTTMTTYILNAYVLRFYDGDTLQILILAEKIIGLSTIFLGLSLSIQPLVGTLNGEGNTKALRLFLRRASIDMVIAGIIVSSIVIYYAESIVTIFGITEAAQVERGVIAVYISAATLICSSLLAFFFNCFYLLGKSIMALITCILKDFLMPVGMAHLLASILDTASALWIGTSMAAVVSLVICMLFVFIRYGKNMFPFLIPKDKDDCTFIYSFDLTEKNAAEMSETAGEVLMNHGCSAKLQTLVGVYIEDILMLIREKNAHRKKSVLIECTLILNETDIRMILRDSGVIFNITDDDPIPDSFRQFTVANMMNALDIKIYLVTTGYNRNEFVFSE